MKITKVFLWLCLFLLVSSSATGYANALQNKDLKAIIRDSVFYDPDALACSVEGGGTPGYGVDELNGYRLPTNKGTTGREEAIDENGKVGTGGTVTWSKTLKNIPLAQRKPYQDYYITMRWNYAAWNWDGTSTDIDEKQYSWFEKKPRLVLVTNPKTNKSIIAAALEAGPGPWVGVDRDSNNTPKQGWSNPTRGTPEGYKGIVSGFPPIAYKALGLGSGDGGYPGEKKVELTYSWASDQNATPGPTTVASGSAIGSTGATGSIYKSGLSAPYTVEQFVSHTLKAIAQKTNKPESTVVTKEHIDALIAFAQLEGGGTGGNDGAFNIFNTKLHTPDLNAVPKGTEDASRVGSGMAANGSDGPATYDYPDFDTGVEATARSMVQGKYQSRLITTLTTKGTTAADFFNTLTYYNKYPGNLAWAAKSDPKRGGNPTAYLNEALSVLASVRKDYAKYANVQLNKSANPATASTQAPCPDADQINELGKGDKLFTTNTSITFPGADEAVARAQRIANMSSAAFKTACPDPKKCDALCDHLAGEVWGYSSSGYYSAKVHWETMVSKGKAHPGDRNPPVGASLFYDNAGKYGHIVTYLGNGLILSNDVLDKKSGVTGGAYIVPSGSMERGPWNLKYLGWAEPVFNGGLRKPAI